MSKTHGKSKTPLHIVWQGMRSRCNNPNHKSYKYYGGKGVSVCRDWDDYIAFEVWAIGAGYAEGLQLDRIDADGPYCPSNCRWVTPAENSRRSSGKRLTMKKAAEIRQRYFKDANEKELLDEYGISRATLWRVISGETWNYGTYTRPRDKRKKITEEDKAEIKRLYVNGLSFKDIAEKFNLSGTHVRHLIKGRNRSDTKKGRLANLAGVLAVLEKEQDG